MKRSMFIPGFTTLAALLLCCITQVSAAHALSFAAHVSYPTGSYCSWVAVGDFNNDGKQDLAAANYAGNSVSILLGDGSGGFGLRKDFATGAGPRWVAVGDFNKDGKRDVVTASSDSAVVSVLLGNGRGGFGAKTDYVTGGGSWADALGDFNNDGRQDLATTWGPTVSVLLGDGLGGFGAKTDFPTAGSLAVAVGDFNKDGKQDLVTANGDLGPVSVLLGDGSGAFGAPTDLRTGFGPVSVAVADLNKDGKQDLVAVNYKGSRVSVMLGDGSGGFSHVGDCLVGMYTGPYFAAIADFNGDRKPDVATVNQDEEDVSVLFGDGKGGLKENANRFDPRSNPLSLAVGDFNRDGKPDIVTANWVGAASYVTVLRNTTPPVISSLKPARGRVGATVTVTGWGFGAKRGTSKVYFGRTAVTSYVSWSAGKLKVKVPPRPKGRIALTIKTPDGKSHVKYFTVL